jgi:hypothetical protein
MRLIFGPHTQRVLQFLADLWLLTPDEIGTVTQTWKEANDLERAEAWAQLHRDASAEDWDKILAAASVARRQAMDAAYLLERTDWAYWAAAWDAAAAIAAEETIGSYYNVLTGPLGSVMPSLSGARSGASVPAQRTEEVQTGKSHRGVGRGGTRKAAASAQEADQARRTSARSR